MTRMMTAVASFANAHPRAVQVIVFAVFLGAIGVVVEIAARLFWIVIA